MSLELPGSELACGKELFTVRPFQNAMWVLTQKELQAVSSADGRHRYEYFIHRVCDAKALWGLYNDGWASVAGEEGEQLIPLWPHHDFAQAFATGNWTGFEPRKIALDEFLDAWIPGMLSKGINPAVFPVPTGTSVVVTAEDLEENLRHELSEVYGIE